MARHRIENCNEFRLARWVTTSIIVLALAIAAALGTLFAMSQEGGGGRWQNPPSPQQTSERRTDMSQRSDETMLLKAIQPKPDPDSLDPGETSVPTKEETEAERLADARQKYVAIGMAISAAAVGICIVGIACGAFLMRVLVL